MSHLGLSIPQSLILYTFIHCGPLCQLLPTAKTSFSNEGWQTHYYMTMKWWVIRNCFQSMSIQQNHSSRVSPRARDLSSHNFVDPITMPVTSYILWKGLNSNQKVFGYSHDMSATIVPVVFTCQAVHDCSSQNSQLHKTDDSFALLQAYKAPSSTVKAS